MAGESGEEKVRNMVSSTGFFYSDISSSNPSIQTHLVNQIHNSFESNPEIFNLTTGMEMNQMIGYQTAKHQSIHDQNSSANMWKGLIFGGKNGNQNHHHHPGGPSSSKSDFYDHFTGGIPNQTPSENLMVQASASWASEPDDSSLMRCVFPCEGNERPSQGLSLSLSSTNPSTIGLQSFELRHTPPPPQQHQDDDDDDDHGFYGKSVNNIQSQHQQQMMQDGYLDKAANFHHGGHFQLRNSKYLGPAQQLLNEFCCLGTKQTLSDLPQKQKSHKTNQWDQEEAGSSSRKQPLYSLELMELQKRKAKLLSMLEEVDRRYKHYCDQMKAVVSAFEAVAGNGAARVYSVLASKAMSRHFRCLRDGIVGQIQATKKAMGEKDPVGIPGSTRGETPRLKLLDQTLRQQRAFQQMSLMESHPWRPQRGLPERSVSVLRAWLFEHFLHPYPSDVDKHILARQTGLSRSQVSNWFINARVRLWKPMVEEMYLEETKEQDNTQASSEDSPGLADIDHTRMNQNLQAGLEDEKPTTAQLVRIDSECLSSIITNPDKNDGKDTENLQNDHFHQQQRSFGRVGDAYGAMELDFSSYNYANDPSAHQHFGGGVGGGGVSLTLGLQQHGGSGGVSLGFSPASQNSSIFYTRDHLEDCQVPIQYSILDGEGQNPPYRNLLGAQLLHDLAG